MKKFLHKGAQIPRLPGVEVRGEFVCFPDSYSIEEIGEIRNKIRKGGRAELETLKRKSYEPSKEELGQILERVESVDRFGFYEAVAAQTYVDRHRDILSPEFLEIMAQKYTEGRAIVHNHDHDFPVGYTFGARIDTLPDGAKELIVKFYISDSALLKSGQSALSSMKDGLIRRVSVSFYSPESVYTPSENSADGRGYWTYFAPENEGDIEVYELSLVTMGAQQGAIVKDAQNGGIDSVPTFESIDAETTKKTEFKMDKRVYEFGNLSLEITEDQVEKAAKIKSAYEDKISKLETSLKAYQDQEAKVIEEKAIELVNLKKEILGDTVNAESEKALAVKMSAEQIEGQIRQFKALKQKSVNQTKPEGGDLPKQELPTEGIIWNF